MRVTSNTFPNTLISQLGDLSARQTRLQAQAATGQRVQLPEDDPSAMRRVLEMQSEAASTDQYSANIARLKDATTMSYSVTKALKTLNDKASELAVKAGGIRSTDDLKSYSDQVEQFLEQAIQNANTTFRGDYLFAGTKVDKPPFEVVKDATGKITGVNYVGNTDPVTSEISPDVLSEAQPVGANSNPSGARGLITDATSGADFFNHLIALRDHLAAGDAKTVTSDDVANLQKDENNFIYHYGHIGAIQSRLDAADGMAKDQSFSLGQQVSGLVDADLAQTLVRLTQVQNAYTAALQSGGSILKTSLLDYLK